MSSLAWLEELWLHVWVCELELKAPPTEGSCRSNVVSL